MAEKQCNPTRRSHLSNNRLWACNSNLLKQLAALGPDEHTLDQGLLCRAGLDGEGPVLEVLLYAGVVEFASNEPLGIKHRVGRVAGHLQTHRAVSTGQGRVSGKTGAALSQAVTQT